MAKRMTVDRAVRCLAAERLMARLELTERDDALAIARVILVVYDGDEIMGRLEVDGGVIEEGVDGMVSMLEYVEGERRKLARSTKLALAKTTRAMTEGERTKHS